MKQKVIIGLVGQQGCGKDTVADYIASTYGFEHISTGDLIRKYMDQNGLGPTTRDRIQATITRLRKDIGPDYLVNESLKQPAARLVLSGLRHPAEGRRIHELGGTLIAIEVSQRTRFERAKGRDRVGDEVDFHTFQQLEATENEKADPAVFNIDAVIKSADYTVTNNGTEQELYQAIDEVMQQILQHT